MFKGTVVVVVVIVVFTYSFYIQTLRPDIYITELPVTAYSLSSHQIKNKIPFTEEKILFFYRFSNTCFGPQEMYGSKKSYKIIITN